MLKKLISALVPALVLVILIVELRNTAQISPQELTTAREKAVAMAEAGDYPGAVERFQTLLELAPENVPLWADYLTVMARHGDGVEAEALKLADQHLDLQRAPAYVIHALFEAALAIGDHERALQLAVAGLERTDDLTTFTLNRSRQLQEEDQLDAAHSLIEATMRKQPENLNLLAKKLLLEQFQNPLADPWRLRELNLQNPEHLAIREAFVDALVIYARGGEAEAALTDLRRLHEDVSADPRLASDTLIVASWAQQHALAVDLFDQGKTLQGDAFTELSAAHSLLELGRLEEAERIYLRYQTDDAVAGLERLKHLREQRELQRIEHETAQQLASLEAKPEPKPELKPESKTAATNPSAESETVAENDYVAQPLSPPDVNLEQAASSATDPAPESALQGGASDAVSTTKAERPEHAKSINDLYTAARYREVTDYYQSLTEGEGGPVESLSISSYEQISDSYMHQGQPQQAVEVLQAVRSSGMDSPRLQSTHLYAYLDQGDYQRAEALLQELNQNNANDPGEQAPWYLWQAAMLKAYQGDDLAAKEQLDALAKRYPNDPQLSVKRGLVARWLGRPRAAEQHYQHALEQRADEPEAATGQVMALLDSRDFARARVQIEALSAEPVQAEDLKALQQRWAVHDSYEFDSRLQFGRSSGNTFGNEDFGFDTHLYSKPMVTHYRGYVHYQDRWARLPYDEGKEHLQRLGLGGDYRSRHWLARAELHQSLRGEADAGVTLATEWQPSDLWSVSAEYQSYSDAVSLRAINDGVEGESLALGFNYRWQPNHRLGSSVQWVEFSDGNERLGFYASHYHRVWSRPGQSFSLIEQAYTSSNSKDSNRLYFNPERDWSLGVAGEYQANLQANSTMQWRHRLTVGLGAYNQKGYGSDMIWDIDYEHRWQLGDRLALNAGLMYRQRVYDGDGEQYSAAYAGLNWRFD